MTKLELTDREIRSIGADRYVGANKLRTFLWLGVSLSLFIIAALLIPEHWSNWQRVPILSIPLCPVVVLYMRLVIIQPGKAGESFLRQVKKEERETINAVIIKEGG